MRKNKIRLSESQLHRVIKESVKNVLKEAGFFDGLRRSWNQGTTTDYLLNPTGRNRSTTQRAVDIDREKGLSGYATKEDQRQMDSRFRTQDLKNDLSDFKRRQNQRL